MLRVNYNVLASYIFDCFMVQCIVCALWDCSNRVVSLVLVQDTQFKKTVLKDQNNLKEFRVQRNSIFQLALRASFSQDVLAQKWFSLAQKNSHKYSELILISFLKKKKSPKINFTSHTEKSTSSGVSDINFFECCKLTGISRGMGIPSMGKYGFLWNYTIGDYLIH